MISQSFLMNRMCVACVAALCLGVSVQAQSITLKSNDLEFALAEAGPVELDLNIVVGSAFELNTVAVALTSNQPGVFAYRDPVYTVGTPFFERDLLVDTLPDPDQPLSQPAIFTFFSVTQTYGLERFPATIVTIHLKSIDDLEAGTYSFSFDPTLTQWGNNFQLTTFVNRGTFTLTVTASDSGGDEGDDGGGDDDDVVGPPVPEDDDGDAESDDDGSSDGGDGALGGSGGSGGSHTAPTFCGSAAGQTLTLSLALLSLSPMRRMARRAYRR